MVDAQYKSDSSPQFTAFVSGINNFFTAIFAAELGINLFANWMRRRAFFARWMCNFLQDAQFSAGCAIFPRRRLPAF